MRSGMQCHTRHEEPRGLVLLQAVLGVLLASLIAMSPISSLANTRFRTISWEYRLDNFDMGIRDYFDFQVVLDGDGNAHVFYRGGENTEVVPYDARYEIFYYPAQAHSASLDVVMSPYRTGFGVALQAAAYDSRRDTLAILWTHQFGAFNAGPLFLSTAPRSTAYNARTWSSREVLTSVQVAGLAVGSDGRMHLAYGLNPENTVRYVWSDDGGRTWSAPLHVHSLGLPGDLAAFGAMRLILDEPRHALHLTWTDTRFDEGKWTGWSVWYAWVDTELQTVLAVEQVDGKEHTDGKHYADYLNVHVGPDGQLLRTWSRGAGSYPGRFQQRYLGDGKWSAAQPILLDVGGGRLGYHFVFWDSTGQAYLLGAGNDRHTGRIYLGLYAEVGGEWVRQDRFPFGLRVEPQGQWIAFCGFAIHRGYQIHLGCREGGAREKDGTFGGLMYLFGQLDATPALLPTTLPTFTPQTMPAPSPSPVSAVMSPGPQQEMVPVDVPQTPSGTDAIGGILAGILGAATTALGSAALVRVMQNRR